MCIGKNKVAIQFQKKAMQNIDASKSISISLTWWCTLVILWGEKQEDHDIEASLGSIVRPRLKKYTFYTYISCCVCVHLPAHTRVKARS